MRERLLDAAEDGIRLHGYHGVSFRELATEIGIKSSSVHYYFRQKEDLGVALVKRYGSRFFESLETKAKRAKSGAGRIRAFCATYRESLVSSEQICLCGILGAEHHGLPPVLNEAVTGFFNSNIEWLVTALPEGLSAPIRRRKAIHIVATLQGAMVLASSLKDVSLFDSAVHDLLAGFDDEATKHPAGHP